MARTEDDVIAAIATLNPCGDWHICLKVRGHGDCNGIDKDLNTAIKNAFDCLLRTTFGIR